MYKNDWCPNDVKCEFFDKYFNVDLKLREI